MLNKPVGMRFIIADTTALLHMGSGDFVLPGQNINETKQGIEGKIVGFRSGRVRDSIRVRD